MIFIQDGWKKENIEPDSAHSILAWGNITEKQKEWLERFVRVWKKAEAKN